MKTVQELYGGEIPKRRRIADFYATSAEEQPQPEQDNAVGAYALPIVGNILGNAADMATDTVGLGLQGLGAELKGLAVTPDAPAATVGRWISRGGEWLGEQAHTPEREARHTSQRWSGTSFSDILSDPGLFYEYVTDPQGLQAELGAGIGSALTFGALARLFPSAAATGLAGKALTPASRLLGSAGLTRMSQALGSNTAKDLLSSSLQFGATMGPAGALINAATIIQPLKERGYSDKEIAERMNSLIGEELPADIVFAALTGNVAKGTIGNALTPKNATVWQKALANASGIPLEGAGGYYSNAYQMILSDKYSDKPYGTLLDPLPNESAAGRMGVLAGVPFAIPGAYNSYQAQNARESAEQARQERNKRFKEYSDRVGRVTANDDGTDAYDNTPYGDARQAARDIVRAGNNGIDAFMRAISGQESSGNYDAVNPNSGATGAFQIMPDNWSAWAQDAGLSPDAPMTPENQKLVARNKMLEYYNKYGNWRDVASMWYSGHPVSDLTEEEYTRPQYAGGQEYPSIKGYVDSIMSRFQEQGGEESSGRARGGNIFGVENYDMPTQGDNITQQVSQLKNGWSDVIPQIGGVLKEKFGLNATISSAARSADHNAEVGGAPNSYHIVRDEGGDALDIVFDRDTTQEEQDRIADYFKGTGLFSEVLYHDVGSGAHLHLGGLKTENLSRGVQFDSRTLTRPSETRRTQHSQLPQEETPKPLFDLNAEDEQTQKLLERFANERIQSEVNAENPDRGTLGFFAGLFNEAGEFQNTEANRAALRERYGDEITSWANEILKQESPAQPAAPARTQSRAPQGKTKVTNEDILAAADDFLERLRTDRTNPNTLLKLQEARRAGDVAKMESILRQNNVEIAPVESTAPVAPSPQPPVQSENVVQNNQPPENILASEQETAQPQQETNTATPKPTKEQKQTQTHINRVSKATNLANKNRNALDNIINSIQWLAAQNNIVIPAEDLTKLKKRSLKTISKWRDRLAEAGALTVKPAQETTTAPPAPQQTTQPPAAETTATPKETPLQTALQRARQILDTQEYTPNTHPLLETQQRQDTEQDVFDLIPTTEGDTTTDESESPTRESGAVEEPVVNPTLEDKRLAERRQWSDAQREIEKKEAEQKAQEEERGQREALSPDIANALAPASQNKTARQRQGEGILNLINSTPFRNMYGVISLPRGLDISLRNGYREGIKAAQTILQRRGVRPVSSSPTTEVTAQTRGTVTPSPQEQAPVITQEAPERQLQIDADSELAVAPIPADKRARQEQGKAIKRLISSPQFVAQYGRINLPQGLDQSLENGDRKGIEVAQRLIQNRTGVSSQESTAQNSTTEEASKQSEATPSATEQRNPEPREETREETREEKQENVTRQEQPAQEDDRDVFDLLPESNELNDVESAESTEQRPPRETPQPSPQQETPPSPNKPAPTRKTPAEQREERAKNRTPKQQQPEDESESNVIKGEYGNEAEIESVAGVEHQVKYKVVEASDLVTSHERDEGGYTVHENPNFPQELQPRDRETVSMTDALRRMIGHLIPKRFFQQALSANIGAPVVRKDGVILNGNGRTIAAIESYKEGKADNYKEALIDNAQKFGINPSKVAKMKQPILVREIVSDDLTLEQQQNIARDAEGGAKMGAREQAKADAKRISEKTLTGFNPNDIDLSASKLNDTTLELLTDVLRDILTGNEINAYADAKGNIAVAGITRAKNALFAYAYGSDELLTRSSEASNDDNIRNVTAALMNAAPQVAIIRAGMQSGLLHNYNFNAIVEAVGKLSDLRKEGKAVKDFLRETQLAGMEFSNEAREILSFIDRNGRSAKRITEFFQNIAQGIQNQGDPKQGSLFGANEPIPFMDLIKTAIKKIEGGMDDLFAAPKEKSTTSKETSKQKDKTQPKADITGTPNIDTSNVVSEKDLTPAQKLLVSFGKKLGVEVVFFNNPDGRFRGVHKGGKTFLNINGNKELGGVFWHESFHWLKNNNPELYKALVKAAGITDAQRRAYLETSKRTDLQSNDEIDEEILADMMDDVAKRTGLFQSIAGKNRGLIERVIQWFKDTLNKFIDHFHNPQGKLTTAQAQALASEFSRIANQLKDPNGNQIFRYNRRTHNVELADSREWSNAAIEEMTKKSAHHATKYFAAGKEAITDEEYLQAVDDFKNATTDEQRRSAFKKLQDMVRLTAEEAGFTNAIPEQTVAYKTRTGAAPKKTIKVYKVFTVADDGSPTALFIGGTEKLPQGVWLDAQDAYHFKAKNGKYYVPSTQNPFTKGGKTGAAVEIPDDATRQELIKRGFLPKGSKATKVTALAYRPGWHAGTLPFFPQGGVKPKNGMTSAYPNIHRYNQVVFECELAADKDFTAEAEAQPKARTKDGKLNTREADLQYMPKNGFYYYATNPLTHGHPELGMWAISGSLKINRALTQEECDKILADNNMAPQEWEQGKMNLADLGYTGVQSDAARKTLAPITYDDNGNVIPLSQRFDAKKDDVRYSIGADDNSTKSFKQRLKNLLGVEGKNIPIHKQMKRQLEDLSDMKIAADHLPEGVQVKIDKIAGVIRTGREYDWANILPEVGNAVAEQLGITQSAEMGNYIGKFILNGAPNDESAEAKEFAKAMRENTEMRNKVMAIRGTFDKWNNMSAEEQMIASTRYDKEIPPLRERAQKFWQYLRTELFDTQMPIHYHVAKFAKATGIKLSESINPEIAFRNLRGMQQRAMRMVYGNEYTKEALQKMYPNVDFSDWKPIAMILESIKAEPGSQRYKLFDQYVKACHFLDIHRHNDNVLMQQGKVRGEIRNLRAELDKADTKKKKAELERSIRKKEESFEALGQKIMDTPDAYTYDKCADLVSKYSDEFGEAQKALVRYSRALLDIWVDSGMMDRRRYHQLLAAYPNYVPLHREFDENPNLNTADSMKHMLGSTKDVKDAIAAIANNTFDYIQRTEKNKAKLLLANLANFDGVGGIFELVDGSSPNDGTIIHFYENGKRKALQCSDEDIVKAVNTMNQPTMNLFLKVLQVPALLLRTMATARSPGFILGNFLRDPQDAFMVSKSYHAGTKMELLKDFAKSLNPFVTWSYLLHAVGAGKLLDNKYVKKFDSKTLEEYLKKFDSKMLEEYRVSGAAQSDFFSFDRDYKAEAIERLTKKNLTRYASPKGVFEFLRKAGEITELATRLYVYDRVKTDRAKKHGGINIYDDLVTAAFESRDFIDFARHGNAGRTWNTLTAFANPVLQGFDKQWRTYDLGQLKVFGGTEETQKNFCNSVARLFLKGILPAIVLSLLHKDEDWYKDDVQDWEKENYWIITETWRVPKGADLGLRFFSNLFERLISNDPVRADKVLQPLKGILPDLMPTAFLPIFECMANYDLFRRQPIVPQREINKFKDTPELQYDSTNSKLAVLLGRVTGVSPRYIDHVIYGYTSGFGKEATHLIDTVTPGRHTAWTRSDVPFFSRVLRTPYRAPKIVSEYYEEFGRQESYAQRLAWEKKHGNPNAKPSKEYDPALHRRLKNIQRAMQNLNAAERAIMDDPKLTSEQVEEKREEIQKRRVELCRKAFQRAR